MLDLIGANDLASVTEYLIGEAFATINNGAQTDHPNIEELMKLQRLREAIIVKKRDGQAPLP